MNLYIYHSAPIFFYRLLAYTLTDSCQMACRNENISITVRRGAKVDDLSSKDLHSSASKYKTKWHYKVDLKNSSN